MLRAVVQVVCQAVVLAILSGPISLLAAESAGAAKGAPAAKPRWLGGSSRCL